MLRTLHNISQKPTSLQYFCFTSLPLQSSPRYHPLMAKARRTAHPTSSELGSHHNLRARVTGGLPLDFRIHWRVLWLVIYHMMIKKPIFIILYYTLSFWDVFLFLWPIERSLSVFFFTRGSKSGLKFKQNALGFLGETTDLKTVCWIELNMGWCF